MNYQNQSIPIGYRDKKEKEKQKEKEKKESPPAPFSPVFHFKEFKVGNLENASAINFGNNYPTNFKGYKKHSQGLGTIDGNNNDIHDLQSHMELKYLVDALVDNDEELPDWIRELIRKYEQEWEEEVLNEDDTDTE